MMHCPVDHRVWSTFLLPAPMDFLTSHSLFGLWGLILCLPENVVFFGILSLLPKPGKKCDGSEILSYVQANKLYCIVSWMLIETRLLSQKDFSFCTASSMSFIFMPVFSSPPKGWHRVAQVSPVHLVGLRVHHSRRISSLGSPHLW